MYACNLRTWETEAGASGVQSETLGSVSSRSARTTDKGRHRLGYLSLLWWDISSNLLKGEFEFCILAHGCRGSSPWSLSSVDCGLWQYRALWQGARWSKGVDPFTCKQHKVYSSRPHARVVLCILYSSPFLCWAYNPFIIRNSRVSVKKLVEHITEHAGIKYAAYGNGSNTTEVVCSQFKLEQALPYLARPWTHTW